MLHYAMVTIYVLICLLLLVVVLGAACGWFWRESLAAWLATWFA